MEIQKITTKKISEQVAEQLEHSIVDGSLPAGEKLQSVRELCEQFQVGRSAVRDAITVLKGKGMVNVVQGEGTFVTAPSEWQPFGTFTLTDEKSIRDLYAVRKWMEIGIAEEAARHRNNEQLEVLEQQANEEGWEADYRFHITLAKATGNDMFVHLMEAISTNMKKALMDCHRMIAADADVANKIEMQHAGIYEAVKQQDPQAAKEIMQKHLIYVEDLLQQALKGEDYATASARE
ncbi:FadR family transcriptional regulator [Salicibibacter halophilus]|uniref:FadR family transcriptional regulator n=1 Tax=Salicibibacter halophilus TaxID=2502791 RepID=A0A514LET5_9BACI|nr:FadR/GntR family transcriptional regulator [Salicibibacter halophilus]QDI90367.1 FadR family transcriptional regulator [Salicibibacter halophilus]